jgi:spermidine synthase
MSPVWWIWSNLFRIWLFRKFGIQYILVSKKVEIAKISPACSGLPVLLPSEMALHCRLSSEGRQRRILIIGTSVPPKKQLKKKNS